MWKINFPTIITDFQLLYLVQSMHKTRCPFFIGMEKVLVLRKPQTTSTNAMLLCLRHVCFFCEVQIRPHSPPTTYFASSAANSFALLAELIVYKQVQQLSTNSSRVHCFQSAQISLSTSSTLVCSCCVRSSPTRNYSLTDVQIWCINVQELFNPDESSNSYFYFGVVRHLSWVFT